MSDLLIEILTEELPARFVSNAQTQLVERVTAHLDEFFIGHGDACFPSRRCCSGSESDQEHAHGGERQPGRRAKTTGNPRRLHGFEGTE